MPRVSTISGNTLRAIDMFPTHQIALPNSSIRSQLHSKDMANSGLIFRACSKNVRVSRIAPSQVEVSGPSSHRGLKFIWLGNILSTWTPSRRLRPA